MKLHSVSSLSKKGSKLIVYKVCTLHVIFLYSSHSKISSCLNMIKFKGDELIGHEHVT